MTVSEAISKMDGGTARLVVQMGIYEALCDEIDRVRPDLEADVAKALGQRASQGLLHLARQPATAQTAHVADQLVDLVMFAKNSDYLEEHNVVQDPSDGKFRRKGFGGQVLDALRFATSRQPDSDMNQATQGALSTMVGPQSDKYSRMRGLGNALAGTNNPSTGAPGLLRMVGDIGPEAQKALEPGIRRTAYRYRGTERRPSAALQENAAIISTVNAGPGKDQQRLEGLSVMGVGALWRQIPGKDEASISLAAGKMPPSLGLMFDGRGRLVSEAMGFNGDHYLPFDLRNLKRLQGGSYVRTRTTGGLTDEDIYTGIMTGARHLTVVSNSGVFTLEFDPSLRGGRRYSDKARQMVDRYARLVGAIGSKQLLQHDLPREELDRLRREAMKDSGGSAENAERLYNARVKEARAASMFLGRSDEDLMQDAERLVRSDKKQQGINAPAMARAIKEKFNELRDDERENTARTYRLDGHGYATAQHALKTEFPYFIRDVNYTPLQQYLDQHDIPMGNEPRRKGGGQDIGYTERGSLNQVKRGVRVDAEDKSKGRTLLGGPDDPDIKRTQGRTPAAAETTSTGGGAAAAGGVVPANAKRTLDVMIPAALKHKQTELAVALQKSLDAVNKVKRVDPNDPDSASPWVDPGYLNTEGAEVPENVAIDAGGDAYAIWLYRKHKSWGKVAEYLLSPQADPRALSTVLEGIDKIQSVLGDNHNLVPKEGLNQAREVVQGVKVLKSPFRPGNDPYEKPEVGATDPQGLPDVTAIELTPEALQKYAGQSEEHAAAFKQAQEWASGSTTGEQIGDLIRGKAEAYEDYAEYAQGNEPMRTLTGQALIDAEDVKVNGPNSKPARELARLHRAWALSRMLELMKATGAAVPFARPAPPAAPGRVGKGDSTPSRLVWHSPSSPLARALARR